jgi:hypothetical protein
MKQVLNFIDGEYRAAEQLLPLVYDELRKLASSRPAPERHGASFCTLIRLE